jgi:DNA-directed RNA polymerase subunit RPC12/RpoP
MAILQAKRPTKLTYERGVLACVKCAAPIYVYKLKKLPDEFSVRCPRCGDRGIYAKRALRRKPARAAQEAARIVIARGTLQHIFHVDRVFVLTRASRRRWIDALDTEVCMVPPGQSAATIAVANVRATA